MNEAPFSTPPQAYMEIISPLIDKARNLLEAGNKLQAFAFVGNLSTQQVAPVMIQPGSGEIKDQSAREIQVAARILDADFVFAIMEAWSLRPDKMSQMDAILDKYGSIGASPYAIDVCALSLETRRGYGLRSSRSSPWGFPRRNEPLGPSNSAITPKLKADSCTCCPKRTTTRCRRFCIERSAAPGTLNIGELRLIIFPLIGSN